VSIVEIHRLSETATRYIASVLRAAVDLLVDVFGPLGAAVLGGALLVIAFEWVRWLIS
jgi:hypothetical protein